MTGRQLTAVIVGAVAFGVLMELRSGATVAWQRIGWAALAGAVLGAMLVLARSGK